MHKNELIDDFIDEVFLLFDIDLLNYKEKVKDGIIITMQDSNKIKIKVTVQ